MIIESGTEINMMDREDLERNQTTSSIVLTDLTMAINTYSQNQLSSSSSIANNSIMCKNNNEFLIGIVFVQDVVTSDSKSSEVPLGTIILDNRFPINGRFLREKIQKSIFEMNESFIFLTKFGTPLSFDQETQVNIQHLLCSDNIVKFKKKSDTNCCSLIGYYSNNCVIFIGFLSVSYTMDLKTTRTIIDEYLRKMTTMKNFDIEIYSYYFLHSSYCIINSNNESNMILIEILRNNSISIKFDKPSTRNYETINNFSIQNDRSIDKKKYIDDIPVSNNNNENDQTDQIDSKNRKILIRRKTSKHRNTFKMAKKQIMISYVRREAAEHALELKKSLIKYGFSVYLDVHEIQHGSDWQDSLNFAIRNCHFFIPLITQNYGRTQWTNREVKLADLLNKHIIPINFLRTWPPECLAIQFSTTHYISGNPKISEHNPEIDLNNDNVTSIDIETWKCECVEPVTVMIKDKINKLMSQENITSPMPTTEEEYRCKPQSFEWERRSSGEQKKFIVISAHPAQLSVSEKIKEFLSNNFDVWCTNDRTSDICSLSINNDPTDEISLSSKHSISILEESTEIMPSQLSRNDKDYARKIAEKSRKRPKSVPNPEKLAIKKKDLVRVKTFGDTPCFPSITPEKKERLKLFEQKASQASLIIILASEQYYKSRTSEQHVFYCGGRMKMILIQMDKSSPPVSISKLICQDNPLIYEDNRNFEENLLERINRTLDPHLRGIEQLQEVKINALVTYCKKNLPKMETCVYILGSTETSDLEPRTVQICEEIGKELAKIPNLNIVTNSTFGASDIVAHTFYQERCSKSEVKSENSSVIHIIPGSENKNKTYGETLFLGDNIKERDPIIARVLDTCVLIGGDQNSVRVVEEFIWNDHYVIPIRSTGGAAGGQYNVPQKVFSCPIGVKENDWAILSDPDATPINVARAVVNVIFDLKKTIFKHAIVPEIQKPFNEKITPHKKKLAARRNWNREFRKLEEERIDSSSLEPTTPDKYLPIFPTQCSTSSSTILGQNTGSKNSFIGKVNKFFKRLTG